MMVCQPEGKPSLNGRPRPGWVDVQLPCRGREDGKWCIAMAVSPALWRLSSSGISSTEDPAAGSPTETRRTREGTKWSTAALNGAEHT
ncbi:hypothetical protein CCHR01_12227 [Colletotrichum chrysophilum]|uniref:Uncharacterized protein n=1 Tax=Colletotrichum chrysophilum TaxID=1836956 RepID=A0AAD9ABP4_9PEZI|nr:hypothetical protein CCHR01_12227 [Colletotrichum chrysophilum]